MKATFSILAAGLFLLASSMTAQVTISDGSFYVGIGPDGELYDSATGYGFYRVAEAYDPLAPGTPRDSWGVTANGSSAYADYTYDGTSGVSSTVSSTSSSATYTTTTSNDLTVVQTYGFAPGDPNILEINGTITNNGEGATDIVFQRDIDWDVYPTEYDENSFGGPITGNVTDSSAFGFENPDPSVAYGDSCAAGCNQTADLGGGIKIDLGMVGAGDSVSFTYLYGISRLFEDPGYETVDSLIAQVDSLGAYYWIATQSSENGAYPAYGENSAIIAVASPVPEPSSWLLLLTVVGGCGLALKRRLSA